MAECHVLLSSGYKGRNCGELINYCDPSPCDNNAQCVNKATTPEQYHCNCMVGLLK